MALLTRWRSALTVLALVGCSIPVSTAAGSTVDCADWNSEEYFQAAGVEDVAACLASGADPETEGELGFFSPLRWALVINKNPAGIAVLLDAGADINAQTEDGNTPLHKAAMFKTNSAAIAALLDAGADPDARTRNLPFGWTPLQLAVHFYNLHNDPAAISALLDAGARTPRRETRPARRLGTTPRTTRGSRVPTPTGG